MPHISTVNNKRMCPKLSPSQKAEQCVKHVALAQDVERVKSAYAQEAAHLAREHGWYVCMILYYLLLSVL